MECNREEAMRLRSMAESKLASQDYMLAKKYALKAQQLFPSLESMVQMMAVIDVHMAALVKIAGCNELDWYGILQVQSNADEAAVKKQYRKLALSLHPDKNKFAGAEAAFKLIGEASQILSDKMKRLVYDAKRGLAQKKPNPLTPSRNHRANNKQSQQQQNMPHVAPQPPSQLHPFTFWTACPFCKMRYQYLRKFEDKNLLCLHCRRAFIAKDLLKMNPTQPAPAQPKYPTSGFSNGSYNVASKNNTPQTASAPKAGPAPAPAPARAPATHVQNETKPTHKEEPDKELQQKAHEFLKSMEQEREQAKQSGEKVTQKQDLETGAYRKVHEFSNSQDKEQAKENVKMDPPKQNMDSELQKRANAFMKSMELEKEQAKQKKGEVKHTNTANNSTTDFPDKCNLAEAERRSAEELHKAELLRQGSMELQKELLKQREQLSNMNATEQSKAIPKVEVKEEMAKQEYFNAAMNMNKKQRRKHYESSSCSSGSDTEDDVKHWKEVAANWKTEGVPRRSSRSKRSVTYDCDDSDDDFQNVPPSKKAKIDEVGCHEQGTKKVSTPQKLANLAKLAIKVQLNLGKTTAFAVEDEAQVQIQEGRGPKVTKKDLETEGKEGVSVSSFTIPDADFFNFDQGREEKDVQVGQVWALYDDLDGMPRYYMKVKDVRSYKPFKVFVGWFEVRKPSEEQSELLDSGYSITCGEFRMSSSQTMQSVNSFSHLVKCEQIGKNIIKIYPRKGEIWCLYEAWKEGQQLLEASDTPLSYCVVEVLSDFNEGSGVSTMLLEKVVGFKTLYRHAHGKVLEIPYLEILRFSHQVPAHKLTGSEAPNVPKDCWELDPAALPSSSIQPA